jgi:hypothetical protein
LNIRSVACVTFGLSLCVWGIAFVGLIALYLLGLVSGGLGGVEGFIASLGFTGFRLSILPFLGVFLVAAGIVSAAAAIAAGVLAHLYNAAYPLVGGVELVTEERAIAPPPRPATPQTPPAPPVAPATPPAHLPETSDMPDPGT